MIEKPFRVAIIGCGWAGFRHARAFLEIGLRIQGGVEITWAVDTNLARAEALRRISGGAARVSEDFRSILNDSTLDAVDICLPHNLHGAAAIPAARAGKHILCEKPIAASLEEADAMIAAARDAGVTLMIAENERFHPAVRKIQELVQQGIIGKVALLQMTRQCYLHRSFTQERPWFLDVHSAAGGAMTSGGVHDFEKARMLVGEVESVYSLRAPQRFLELGGDDTSIAAVRFQNGVVGTFVLTFLMKSLETAAGNEVHTLRLDGELGSISMDDGRTIRIYSEHPDWQNGETLIEHRIIIPEEDTFQLEVAHFIECTRSHKDPITSGTEERKPLEAVLAAYRSMETGLVEKL